MCGGKGGDEGGAAAKCDNGVVFLRRPPPPPLPPPTELNTECDHCRGRAARELSGFAAPPRYCRDDWDAHNASPGNKRHISPEFQCNFTDLRCRSTGRFHNRRDSEPYHESDSFFSQFG